MKWDSDFIYFILFSIWGCWLRAVTTILVRCQTWTENELRSGTGTRSSLILSIGLMLFFVFTRSCRKVGDTWYSLVTTAQAGDIWSGAQLAKTKSACQCFLKKKRGRKRARVSPLCYVLLTFLIQLSQGTTFNVKLQPSSVKLDVCLPQVKTLLPLHKVLIRGVVPVPSCSQCGLLTLTIHQLSASGLHLPASPLQGHIL